MASEVPSSVLPHHAIPHSQLVLPKRKAVLPAVPDNCECLWVRVNRICDQYMPELFDLRIGPRTWCAPEENRQR